MTATGLKLNLLTGCMCSGSVKLLITTRTRQAGAFELCRSAFDARSNDKTLPNLHPSATSTLTCFACGSPLADVWTTVALASSGFCNIELPVGKADKRRRHCPKVRVRVSDLVEQITPSHVSVVQSHACWSSRLASSSFGNVKAPPTAMITRTSSQHSYFIASAAL